MAISGPASFEPTINAFLSHWLICNNIRPAASPLLVRVPEKDVTFTRLQLVGLRDQLVAQQGVVQGCLTQQQVARGAINNKKATLLARFTQFNSHLDGNYRNTDFYEARPLAPSFTDGQESFSRAVMKAVKLWEQLNVGPAPAGMTLPLVLPAIEATPGTQGTLDVGAFASLLASLQFDYALEVEKEVLTAVGRAGRNRIQDKAYEIMKAYRENVPPKMSNWPELVETMPRLTPLPGHTPDAVNASAVLEGANQSKTVYDESTDAMLEGYQLRGNVGDDFSEENAVVIATNAPGAPREFITAFGLNQPGAKIALKVYVILTTGNEAGSAAMMVERPVSLGLAA